MTIKRISGWGIFLIVCAACVGLSGSVYAGLFSWDFLGQVIGLRSNNDVTALRARVATLEQQLLSAHTCAPSTATSSLMAKVFSVYPFNEKSRIFLSVGSADGVAAGDAVVGQGNVFIGRVVTVYQHASEVMTIFDQNFSLSVRVGDSEVDGSLQGGVTPRVIYAYAEKAQHIQTGDAVASADKAYPYGLLVGTVRSFQQDRSGSFFNSDVEAPYAVKDLRTVFVFPAQTHP